MASITIDRISGQALAEHLPALAELRIRVFREFPYLYEGSAEYEERYLRKYVESPQSIMILVRDGTRIVGASSGLPLADEAPELRQPFEEHGHNVESIFYCVESVLLPEYRGQGLGVRFFEEREAHAEACGMFDQVTFCAVERPQDHPRRPVDYVPLDDFWSRRGYERQAHLRAYYEWQDLDEEAESPKPMVFWVKALG